MPEKQNRSNRSTRRNVPISLIAPGQPEQAAPFLDAMSTLEARLLDTKPEFSVHLRVLHLRQLRRTVRAILNGEDTPGHRISVADALLYISQHPLAPSLRAMRDFENDLFADPNLTSEQLSLVYAMRQQRYQLWHIMLYGVAAVNPPVGAETPIMPGDPGADDILADDFGQDDGGSTL